jgi:hypothetical protein
MFNVLAQWMGNLIDAGTTEELSYHSGEDSLGMFYNLFNVLLISFIVYTAAFVVWRHKLFSLLPYVKIYFRYYLAVMLLIYGFDKIYKYQFYYPEPNILYSDFKDVPQDLRYWSVMGTSYSYTLFAGLMEVVPGVLLLWRRTSLLGAALAFLVLGNVFMTNVGFDITIKTFSFFLLSMSLMLLLPYLKHLWLMFTGGKGEFSKEDQPIIYKKQYYIFIKVVALLIISYESQYKLIASGSFNDDNAARPELHGAYKVIEGGDLNWEMIFFHRQGYFIVADSEGHFYDFILNVDKPKSILQLTTYDKEKLILKYEINQDTLSIIDQSSGFSVKALKVYTYNPLQLN